MRARRRGAAYALLGVALLAGLGLLRSVTKAARVDLAPQRRGRAVGLLGVARAVVCGQHQRRVLYAAVSASGTQARASTQCDCGASAHRFVLILAEAGERLRAAGVLALASTVALPAHGGETHARPPLTGRHAQSGGGRERFCSTGRLFECSFDSWPQGVERSVAERVTTYASCCPPSCAIALPRIEGASWPPMLTRWRRSLQSAPQQATRALALQSIDCQSERLAAPVGQQAVPFSLSRTAAREIFNAWCRRVLHTHLGESLVTHRHAQTPLAERGRPVGRLQPPV